MTQLKFDETTMTYKAVFETQPVMTCSVCKADLGFKPGLKTPYMRSDGKLFCKKCAGKEIPIYWKGYKIDSSKYTKLTYIYYPLAGLKIQSFNKKKLLASLLSVSLSLLKLVR